MNIYLRFAYMVYKLVKYIRLHTCNMCRKSMIYFTKKVSHSVINNCTYKNKLLSIYIEWYDEITHRIAQKKFIFYLKCVWVKHICGKSNLFNVYVLLVIYAHYNLIPMDNAF